MKRKGEDNLIPFNERSEEERKRLGRIGGVASGKKRRAMRDLYETAVKFLNESDKAMMEEMVAGLIDKANKGNDASWRILIDILKHGGHEADVEAKAEGANVEKKRLAAENRKKVRAKRQYIVKLLKEAGLYKAEMTYQVNMLANNLISYNRLVDYSLSCQPVIEITSREGDARPIAHPVFGMISNMAHQIRLDLNAMLMNYHKSATVESGADDLMAKLLSGDEG